MVLWWSGEVRLCMCCSRLLVLVDTELEGSAAIGRARTSKDLDLIRHHAALVTCNHPLSTAHRINGCAILITACMCFVCVI